MDSEVVRRLFDYNEWAWQRVFPSLAALPHHDYTAEYPFYWHSLHALAVHCYNAEWIWFRRLQGEAPTAMMAPTAFASFAVLREAWDLQRTEWRTLVGGLNEPDLAQTFHYRDTSGNHFSVLLGDLLHHVINHATEHRSQMTPVLYQLGYPTEPLDMIIFARTSYADES
jgi:uncharacterized damage-inducible protein DinB